MNRPDIFSQLMKRELALFAKLNTPAKIQDWLGAIPFNFETEGPTCYSPRQVMQYRKAHCFEGACFAAAVLWYHKQPPLVMRLCALDEDDDHVIALFRRGKLWGAISKTNHAVLRYREPVYINPRELAMSFFHEYFLNRTGKKTLRSYIGPHDARTLGLAGWVTARSGILSMDRALFAQKKHGIVPPGLARSLRPAEPIEREAGRITQWSKDGS